MKSQLPQHIAVVMDGNGRWAESRGLLRIEGHRAGVLAIKTIIKSALEHGIAVLSLFAFSSENWSRPESEVEFLMRLFLDALRREVQELHDNGICLQFTGDKAGLPREMNEEMAAAERLTRDNQRLTLNLVFNYGGKWDIVEATKKIAQQVQAGALRLDDIDEPLFCNYLATKGLPDPDLFIRTSGETRISNFFLWQLAYTELYFTETYWPDFDAAAFDKALLSYQSRQRRFGKTTQQINEI